MIPVFRPSYDRREEQAIVETLRSGWVGMGPKTEKFEKEFAQYVGAEYAIAVNSCTAALHIALKLLNVGPGDEVLVPTITFVSTAHAVCYVGATPVFCDVNERDLCIDWKDAVKKITPKTKAIIPVLYGGKPIYAPADIKLPRIYDCAHAAGSKFIATGRLCCWSFHAVKNLATGDGGMITTCDEQLAERARRLRWMGINRNTWDRSKGGYQWEYGIDEIGYKYHYNDLAASIGLVQLSKLPAMQARRESLVESYLKYLRHIEPPAYNTGSSWHLVVGKTDRRDELADFLRSRGISTGVHYKPIHLYPCYKQKITIPVAEKIWPRILTLPLYPDMCDDEVRHVCDEINNFFVEKR